MKYAMRAVAGLFSLLPLVFISWYFIKGRSLFLSGPPEVAHSILLAFAATTLVTISLTCGYLVHLRGDLGLSRKQKLRWVVALLVLNAYVLLFCTSWNETPQFSYHGDWSLR